MNAEQLFEQGAVAARDGNVQQALDLLAHCIITDPGHADAWALRGRVLFTIGRNFDALLHYDNAVSLAPHRFDIWSNRGLVCGRLLMFRDAEASFKKSLELADRPEPHMNLAEFYIIHMRIEEAEQHAIAAARMADNPHARAKLGLIWLALGHWRRGWDEYEQRYRTQPYPPRQRLEHKQWQGERLKGKSILLYSGGGGYGDEILGLRFVQTIRKLQPEQIILNLRPALMGFTIKGITDEDVVRLETDRSPLEADYSCDLIDVAKYAHIDKPEQLPGKTAYLLPKHVSNHELPNRLRVGLCWKSGKRPLRPDFDPIAEAKSIPLGMFSFLKRPDVALVSLQKDDDAGGMVDFMSIMKDFADTAALINELDLVISVDTAVAHLAGAMGKPVWCLVRFGGICLWMRETKSTCWYDSMKLYRQTKLFDWTDQLSAVAADLDRLCKEKADGVLAA